MGSQEPYVKTKPRFSTCPIITCEVCCFPCCIPLSCWGASIKKKPQLPLDEQKLASDGGTYAVAADGRKVEYFVYGSSAPGAKVVVNLHGSGLEARCEKEFYAPICEKLGVKGISVSWGGHGYSDGQEKRQVSTWAKTDLEVVLAKEKVDKFMVTGHSSGNPHAMVSAWQFPSRCIGLGLNAPLVPLPTVQKYGLKGALGAESLPTTQDLEKWRNSWWFALLRIGTKSMGAKTLVQGLYKTNPKIKDDKKMVEWLMRGFSRATDRGTGFPGGWESAVDTCYEWGFDPEEIQTRNIVVWHAADDKECDPGNGKWLADMFKEKGAQVNFKNPQVGYGHFTFYQGEYAEPKSSIINALLKQL